MEKNSSELGNIVRAKGSKFSFRLPHRHAVSCLFKQDMRKFSDFDYKDPRNDWNHAEITFIAQISREI